MLYRAKIKRNYRNRQSNVILSPSILDSVNLRRLLLLCQEKQVIRLSIAAGATCQLEAFLNPCERSQMKGCFHAVLQVLTVIKVWVVLVNREPLRLCHTSLQIH